MNPESALDFDEWANLARSNPAAFEAKRRQYIEAFINTVPEDKRQRLVGLQWQIDQARRLARSPMASCIAISNMMWQSLERLRQEQNRFLRQEPLPTHDAQMACILPFPAR
jgi:hypothetical protein